MKILILGTSVPAWYVALGSAEELYSFYSTWGKLAFPATCCFGAPVFLLLHSIKRAEILLWW